MSPPSYCSKLTHRSTGDNYKTDGSTSEDSSSDEDESKATKVKYDGMGIVKTFLGPSLEDAVLKTFEFGKSLIQKPDDVDSADEDDEGEGKCSGDSKPPKSEMGESAKGVTSHQCFHTPERSNSSLIRTNFKKLTDGRFTRKRIVFTAKLDKELPLFKQANFSQKFPSVAKIRSLDSDLKQLSPSPEKIKRQLEALIQINKDEPPERVTKQFYLPKESKFHQELTVMPSLCVCKNEIDDERCSTTDAQSLRKSSDCGQSSSSRFRINARRNVQSGICQAPEFLTSALGPSLDVSIIDNLKMIRNLFKAGDNGKGEGSKDYPPCSPKEDDTSQLLTCQEELECRINELKKTIEVLSMKECCLQKQIEEEERERECKRQAFEEEEKKICKLKASLEEEKSKQTCRTTSETDLRYANLKQKIACEEEKLSRLKEQYDCYKKEIFDAKARREALKRNKSLLDAWDVIASRVCHTRLPSFSRVHCLDRKQLNAGDVGTVHCCFMPQGGGEVISAKSSERKVKGKSRASSSMSVCLTSESVRTKECSKDDPPFPLQRDIACGLHKALKPCCCCEDSRTDWAISDDEAFKKSTCAKLCRSKSDTTMKFTKCSKIIKVLWAITRINVFQDNCKTYEVMDATPTPPDCLPVRTEGIFVVKTPKQKSCLSATPNRNFGKYCGKQY